MKGLGHAGERLHFWCIGQVCSLKQGGYQSLGHNVVLTELLQCYHFDPAQKLLSFFRETFIALPCTQYSNDAMCIAATGMCLVPVVTVGNPQCR